MKRFISFLLVIITTSSLGAQGWPEKYEGVMLQGFYWDSFDQSRWKNLEKQADELSQYFSLVWIPQSGNCGGTSMGYDDLYWFPGNGHYDSSFGTEAELRSMIQTFKAKGIGTIADVVVNHRKNVSNWVDFPAETYQGVTYQLQSTDICSDDDGGETKKWATENGYSVSSNKDTGEGWGGMRDLDHQSSNVQKNVKAYLKMLMNDLGYVGFRYDMVKGYSGSYTKEYNNDAKPQFSVGECWDGTKVIRDWIDATDKTSAAFDFQFRYAVRNAINNNNWNELGRSNGTMTISGTNYPNWPLVHNNYENGSYRQWAVTFVENHDTEKRSNAAQDPIKKDTLAANAYLLAMPGTPCVFLTHWIDCKKEIKAMIDVRRAAGIQNTSSYESPATNLKYYAVTTTGTKGKLTAVLGPGSWTPGTDFVKVLSGYHYAYYLSKSMETAWVDLPSGEYEGTQKALLTAVSTNSNAQLVYTTDGTTPTASSTKVASGTSINIEGDVTLKVGLLIGSTVSGIVTRTYTKATPFDSYTINVYVNTEQVNWTTVNFWTWGGNGSHAPKNPTWPGDKVSTTTTVKEKKWFMKQYTITSSDDYVNFVFSTGTGSPQTVDINNVTTEKFFEISSEKDGAKYLVNDVTSSYTAIEAIQATPTTQDNTIYDIYGRKRGTDWMALPKGLYIINGKKVLR